MSNGRTVHGQPMSKSIWTNMYTPKSVQKIFYSNGWRPNILMAQMGKTKWTWPAKILKISRTLFIGEKSSLFSCRQIHERARFWASWLHLIHSCSHALNSSFSEYSSSFFKVLCIFESSSSSSLFLRYGFRQSLHLSMICSFNFFCDL